RCYRDWSSDVCSSDLNCQAGFEGLGLPIQADQNAAGEVANGLGSILLHQQRIESFRFRAETEVKLAARLAGSLGANEGWPAKGKVKSKNKPNAAYHWVTSCDGRTN